MECSVVSQTNAKNDIILIALIEYTIEEREALTETAQWEAVCLDKISAHVGLFRGFKNYYNLTFHEFASPGFRIDGFTDTFAPWFGQKFRDKYFPRVVKAMAPILGAWRGQVHSERASARDNFIGVTQRRLIGR